MVVMTSKFRFKPQRGDIMVISVHSDYRQEHTSIRFALSTKLDDQQLGLFWRSRLSRDVAIANKNSDKMKGEQKDKKIFEY